MSIKHNPVRDYTALSYRVAALSAKLRNARDRDVTENYQVLNSNVLTSLSCTYDAAWSMVSRDNQEQYARAQAAMGRIWAAHGWLSASAQSPQALGTAEEQWSEANDVSSEMEEEMTVVEAQQERDDWTGNSAEGHRRVTREQLMAQERLVKATHRVAVEIDRAALLTAQIFNMANAIVEKGNARCSSGPATRAITSNTSLFSLNSRTRVVADALETVASDYENLRGGGGWQASSAAIAARMAQAVDVIRTFRPMAGGRGPIPM